MNRNSGEYEDVHLHETMRKTQYYLLYLKGLKAEDCSDSTPWRQLRVCAPGEGGPSAATGWAKEEADLSRPPMPSGASGTLALWEENLELLIPEQLLDREFKVEVYSKGALGRATVLAEGVFCPRNELLLPNALPIYIQVELFSQNVSTKRITAKGSAQITAVLEKSLEKFESIVPPPAAAPALQKKPKQEDSVARRSGSSMPMATPPPPPPPFQNLDDDNYTGVGSYDVDNNIGGSNYDSSSSTKAVSSRKNRLSVRQRFSAGIKTVQRLMSFSPSRLLTSFTRDGKSPADVDVHNSSTSSIGDSRPPPPPPPPPLTDNSYNSPSSSSRPGSRRESGEYDEEAFIEASHSFSTPLPPPTTFTPYQGDYQGGASVIPPKPPSAPLSSQGSVKFGALPEASRESLVQDNEVLRNELKRANKELDDAVLECYEISSKWERMREAMASYKEEIDGEKLLMQEQLDALREEVDRAKGHVGDRRAESNRLGRELNPDQHAMNCDGHDTIIMQLKQQLHETQSSQRDDVERIRLEMEAQKRDFDKEKLDLCSKILLRSSSPMRRQSVFRRSPDTLAPSSSNSSSNSSSSSSVSPNRRRSVAVAHEEVNRDELELWMNKYVEISVKLDQAKRELALARQASGGVGVGVLSDESYLLIGGADSIDTAPGMESVDTCASEDTFPEYSIAVLSADDDIVYESISVQAQLAAALDDNEALVTSIFVHMSSISKEARTLAERNLAEGQKSEYTRLINFSKAIEKLLSDSQLLSDMCPAFALSPHMQSVDGSDSNYSRNTRLSRLHLLLERSLSLVSRIETSLGMGRGGAETSPQSPDGHSGGRRRSSSVRASIRLSRRYSSPFRDDPPDGGGAADAVPTPTPDTPGDHHHHHHSHSRHNKATLNDKLKLIYDDLQPMTDTLKDTLQESPYLSPEDQQRAKHYGTKFLTSTYFFNAANTTDGHSIGSLLIKSSCLPVVQAIFKSWPDLELSIERNFNYGLTSLKSSSPDDQKVSASKIDVDSKNVDFSNPKALRALGFTLTQIKQSGRFGERDFLSFGLSAKELRSIGFDVIKLRKAGYSVIDCFKAGFNAQQLRKGGFDDSLVVKSGRFTPQLLHHAGFDVQRHALVSLFEALDGNHWRNKQHWCSARPLGEWHGVHLNGAGLVKKLDLRSNLLYGELPASIALLSSLEYLDLGTNDLFGELPTGPLSTLLLLRDLWLTNNPRLLVRPSVKPALRAALPKCVFRIDVNADLPNMLQE